MLPVSIVTMVSPACFVSSMSRLPKPQLETDCVDELASVRPERLDRDRDARNADDPDIA